MAIQKCERELGGEMVTSRFYFLHQFHVPTLAKAHHRIHQKQLEGGEGGDDAGVAVEG